MAKIIMGANLNMDNMSGIEKACWFKSKEDWNASFEEVSIEGKEGIKEIRFERKGRLNGQSNETRVASNAAIVLHEHNDWSFSPDKTELQWKLRHWEYGMGRDEIWRLASVQSLGGEREDGSEESPNWLEKPNTNEITFMKNAIENNWEEIIFVWRGSQ